MLHVKDEFLNKIINCPWFEKCGVEEEQIFKFDIKYLTLSKAKKSSSSIKWENKILDVNGDFTEYLFLNHQELYNKWNEIVDDIKMQYMGTINVKLKEGAARVGLESEFATFQYIVLYLFMADVYSEYYCDDFYNNMLEIFLSGHIPCGWEGNKKSGRFLVY